MREVVTNWWIGVLDRLVASRIRRKEGIKWINELAASWDRNRRA